MVVHVDVLILLPEQAGTPRDDVVTEWWPEIRGLAQLLDQVREELLRVDAVRVGEQVDTADVHRRFALLQQKKTRACQVQSSHGLISLSLPAS
jgi:hypothetical protein